MRKWISFLLVLCLSISGCNKAIYNQTEANIADVKQRTNEARHKSDMDAARKAPLVIKRGMYIDTQPVSLYRDPFWLNNTIVIRGDQLPFSYYSRIIGQGAGRNILTRYQNGLDQSVNVSINYTGSVRGALDLLATKTGYVYSIQGDSIYWQSFLTKTFDVAFMPGGSDYMMGQSSQGATSSAGETNQGITSSVNDSTDNQFSSQSAKLSIWKDLDTTIKQILSPDGKVMVSESTTSVTVRDRPSNVKLVGQYIANLNHNLSKQVLVKIQVLEIDLTSDFNFGLNWNVIASAFNHSPFVLTANYGTPVAITPLVQQEAIANATEAAGASGVIPVPNIGFNGDGTVPSYKILVNALKQQGKVSVVSEPRVVCLNNQVSTIRITDQEGYLAEIQNTTVAGIAGSGGTITSQVTPGTLITGITLYILPKILGEKVYLQVNADLSNNLGFQKIGTGGANNQEIQLPHLSAKHFNQRSMITSGSTLILSGFRKLTNQTGAMQLFDSQALGGRGSKQKNSETIVLITPIILHGMA